LTGARLDEGSKPISEVNKTVKFGYLRKNMQISAEKIWHSAQEHLRAKLSQDTFSMWFAPLQASAMDGSHITIEAPNEFCEVWLKDNYLGLMQDAVAAAAGCKLQVKFKAIAPQSAVPKTNARPAAEPAKLKAAAAIDRAPTNGDLHFNPKNTFESFVVGGNNNFAYAVAKAVAESPGKVYNPLFLHGGVGLGKTHLLQAIGQHVAGNKKVRALPMCLQKNLQMNTSKRFRTTSSWRSVKNIVRAKCC